MNKSKVDLDRLTEGQVVTVKPLGQHLGFSYPATYLGSKTVNGVEKVKIKPLGNQGSFVKWVAIECVEVSQ